MPVSSESGSKVYLLHPGTQYSFNLAIELFKKNLLGKYITSFCVSEYSWVYQLFKNTLKNRVLKEVPNQLVKKYPQVEGMAYLKRLWSSDQEDIFYKRNLLFQNLAIKNDLHDAEIVIGFDTSSWKVARYCRQHEKRFILDVSIGHPLVKEAVFENIRKLYPEWPDIAKPKNKTLIDLELEEFDLANEIVVPSHFVRQTLIDQKVNEKKIVVNPFGTSVQSFSSVRKQEYNSKITFLFFGSLTARKGLPLLLKAWELLQPTKAQLIIAGYGQIPETVTLGKNVRLMGLISPSDRSALFAQADVFVFPSYFEGLAQVQIEAAASGLPIIGTKNSGAEEIVRQGQSGFIIDPGSLDQLMEAIRFFIDNPAAIRSMGQRIRQGIDYFSLEAYGERWSKILASGN